MLENTNKYIYEALVECESHLKIAIWALGSYAELNEYKYHLALQLNEIKAKRKEFEE